MEENGLDERCRVIFHSISYLGLNQHQLFILVFLYSEISFVLGVIDLRCNGSYERQNV